VKELYCYRMDDKQAQVFGARKSADTRKALRFFAERRVKTHFVDFTVRGPSPGELRRFVQKFGAAALVDRKAPRFAELGLRAAQLGDDRWLDTLVAEPLLLRLPLVRFGNELSVGADEPTWRSWLA
jgi:arsenate reductase (glutaredoxin)